MGPVLPLILKRHQPALHKVHAVCERTIVAIGDQNCGMQTVVKFYCVERQLEIGFLMLEWLESWSLECQQFSVETLWVPHCVNNWHENLQSDQTPIIVGMLSVICWWESPITSRTRGTKPLHLSGWWSDAFNLPYVYVYLRYLFQLQNKAMFLYKLYILAL